MLGHIKLFQKLKGLSPKEQLSRFKQHMRYHVTGKEPSGMDDAETVHQIKKLMKGLEEERQGSAEEMKAILEERGGEQYFVHPFSGHVYAVTGRYPYRISDLLPSIWGLLDGPAGPVELISDGMSGATGIAYTTYDAWGRPVYGMPIRAYQESEAERFAESMERQEAPFAQHITTGRQEYGLPNGRYMHEVPAGMADGMLGAERGFTVWRLDNMMTSHYYVPSFGVPYYDKKNMLRMALGRHQWEAEDQFLKLLQAGVVAAPYHGEVDPTAFGFDMAARMG